MMNGKGIFIWKSKSCADGSIRAIVDACTELGLSWVAIKIGDANNSFYRSFDDMQAAVRAFQDANIAVWLWHYIYGEVWFDKSGVPHSGGASPEQEAQFALSQVNSLQADGYIIDAEKEFKVLKQAERAHRFMKALGNVGIPVALSSYRFPSYHREFAWDEFLSGCFVHMPQVYWMPPGKARGPVYELERSIKDLLALRAIPVCPIGRAYIGDGHPGPAPKEIEDFAIYAQSKDCCPGISFWALDFLYLHPGGTLLGKAIADAWNHTVIPPEEPDEMRVFGSVRTEAAPHLNLRAGPGTIYADIGDIKPRTVLYVFEQDGDWVRIGANVWIKTGENLATWIERL